jgi:hypothetical protein
MEKATENERVRSSHTYIWMLSRGKISRSDEHDNVRKCDGLLSTEGRLAIALSLMTLPMRAWFFNKIAETRVETTPHKAARSMLPADTRS